MIGVFFFLSFNSYGQEFKKGFDPKYSLKDLAMDTWTNKSGLVSNNVISIIQDKKDYLWIASYNGLQKFDGNKFEIYDQTNVPFLSSNTIYDGTQGQNGTLWFCTGSSGIIGYDEKRFIQLPLHDSIPNSVVSIYADTNVNLWIGSKNNGLYKYEPSGNVIKIEEVPDVTVHSITEDTDQNIWIASDKGAYKISGNQVRQYSQSDGLPSELISTVFASKRAVYIGTLHGISVVENNEMNNLKAFEGDIINDIVVDDYDMLWVGTERGLIRYNPMDQNLENFSEPEGLPSKRVVDLFFDDEGSLWVCTYEGGLVRFKSGIITNLTIKNGLTTNQVHIINKKGKNHYIGTQDGSISIYDGRKIIQLKLHEEFQKDVIREILFEDETTWIVNYKGLLEVRNGKQTYLNENNGLPNNSIRTIFKDSKGHLWLGTRTGGLIKYDKGGNHQIFDKNSGLLTNYVFCVDEDSKGNLMIGTNAGGLSILSPTREWSHVSLREDNSGTLIFNLLIDDQDHVWLCTNLGLFRYSEKGIEKVEFGNGLKVEKFFDIIDDQAGNFWLTSPVGVYKIRQKDLAQFFAFQKNKVPYELFGEEDGMESQECTGATKSFFDQETGKLWIPTFEGVAIIDPSQKVVNRKVPKVYITNVQIDNNSIFPIVDGVEIKPGTFRYLFDVTAMSFLAPSKVQFKYKLEGIDEKWNGPTENRRIEYTNLPYGDYTLRVKASNNDNIWNEEGAQLSFTVLPHFFEALWFRISVVLFIVLLFWGFYTWRTYDIKKTNRILRKMNSELDRFVYSASHDLRGPLTSTMGIVNLAIKENDPEQNHQYFALIRKCTDKMNHFINELINYSKNKNDALEVEEVEIKQLIDSIWDGLSERETVRQIAFRYISNGTEKLISDKTRLRVILRNILHNAIVFYDPEKPDPHVQVEFYCKNKVAKLIVSDNGVGIPKASQEKIFDMFFRANDNSIGSGLGLYVVQETAQRLDATIEVVSEEGKGSKFIISLPAKIK